MNLIKELLQTWVLLYFGVGMGLKEVAKYFEHGIRTASRSCKKHYATIVLHMKVGLLVALLFLPHFVFAQNAGYDPVGIVTCSGPNCNLCTFIEMVNMIINWLFGFLTLAAVLIIVIAGLKLVVSAGNPSAMQDAKKMLTNVLVGFVIVLAAWLIVDTIMKVLMNPNYSYQVSGREIKFGPWNQIDPNQCGGMTQPEVAEQMYCFTGPTIDGTIPGLAQCQQKRQEAIAAGHTGLTQCSLSCEF